MSPNDLIQVTYPNGATKFWVVTGIYLGAVDQESVIELEPIGQTKNTQGTTRCPADLLYALTDGGSIKIFTPSDGMNR